MKRDGALGGTQTTPPVPSIHIHEMTGLWPYLVERSAELLYQGLHCWCNALQMFSHVHTVIGGTLPMSLGWWWYTDTVEAMVSTGA